MLLWRLLEISALVKKVEKDQKLTRKALDAVSEKRPRGPRPTLPPSEIAGRAEDFAIALGQLWELHLWPRLSSAHTPTEVERAFREGVSPYEQTFAGLDSLVFQVLREPTFPKKGRSQSRFLAESLAGLGMVSPRRSRDICAEEREKARGESRILKFEFYIECSCRFKGHSIDKKCPKCGAKIEVKNWFYEDLM